MLREMPEMEEKVNSGELSLTNMNMAQSLFKKELFTREKKKEILLKLENKSTAQAKKISDFFAEAATNEQRLLVWEPTKWRNI